MRLELPAADAMAGVAAIDVDVYADGATMHQADQVATEEPLEIGLAYGPEEARLVRGVAVTMRTPGDDLALALGFLYSEGVVRSIDDVVAVDHVGRPSPDKGLRNEVLVELSGSAVFDEAALSRNVYTSSSCGVCGKTSIDAVRTQIPPFAGQGAFRVEPHVLGGLPERLRQRQATFERTGGLHASATFDRSGRILELSEDVGRHNALDKLVGGYLSRGQLPLSELGLIFSGRASFELVQKAAMAGCPLVAAIGPPSSLAVELADEQGMTLIGFLRERRFNVYTHHARVLAGA